jgi:hypothetical protein
MKLNKSQINTLVNIIYQDISVKHSENNKLLKKQTIEKFKKLPIYKKIKDINDFGSDLNRSYDIISNITIEDLALKYFKIKLPSIDSYLIKIQIENKLVLKTIGSDIDITSIIEQIKNEL